MNSNCPKCGTDDGPCVAYGKDNSMTCLERQVDRSLDRIAELEAELHQQAVIIGKSIDDSDKWQMDKRGMECRVERAEAERDALKGVLGRVKESIGHEHTIRIGASPDCQMGVDWLQGQIATILTDTPAPIAVENWKYCPVCRDFPIWSEAGGCDGCGGIVVDTTVIVLPGDKGGAL